MNFSRREFIGSGIAAASAVLLPGQEHHHKGESSLARPALRATELQSFVDRLVIPPVAVSRGTRARVPAYRLPMREIHAKVHRDLEPTRFWSYGNTFPGPTIEVRRNHPIQVEWPNELPARHFLPIDHTLHGLSGSLPEVRAAVHVHGARVPPESDGYPDAWYTPGNSRTMLYPNDQEAAFLWYHDHAMGITRLNIFAGLLGAYIVRDDVEAGLNLPAGEFELPLILCDRSFDKGGQLNYPVSPREEAPWVPEFFGDAMLVNGKLMPFAEVKPAVYRLRVLNACNARFLNLSFESGEPFVQIGSDQGLLGKPITHKLVSLAPGERADLLVNFAASGGNVVLKNDVLPLMQFRVAGAADRQFAIPAVLRTLPRTPESEAVKTRVHSLDEILDDYGVVQASLLNNSHWHDPITEKPVLDTTEIWSFVNATEDTHPIHLHPGPLPDPGSPALRPL